jgi:hypothetical protein
MLTQAKALKAGGQILSISTSESNTSDRAGSSLKMDRVNPRVFSGAFCTISPANQLKMRDICNDF